METETPIAKKEESRPVEYGVLNSLEDERAVLGAVLLEPKNSGANFRKLSKDLFYDTRNRKIFDVCRVILAEGGLLGEQVITQKLKKEGDGAVEEVPATLVQQLVDGGRVVTGLVERGVTRLCSGRVGGGVLGLSSIADLEMVVLPGFAAPERFVF